MAFKPIDGKRDEFRKYLERTGVLEAISKVFVKLVNCPERPENAIEFIRENLGDTLQQADTIDKLKQDLEDARSEISQLKRTIDSLLAEKTKNLNIVESDEINSSTSSVDESQNAIVKENLPDVQQESFVEGNEQKDESTAICAEPADQGNESQNSSTKDDWDNNKPPESESN